MPKDHSEFFMCVYIKYICMWHGDFLFCFGVFLIHLPKQKQHFTTMHKPMFLGFHNFKQYKKSFLVKLKFFKS